MLTYSVVATIYLGHVAIVGEFVGPLLWGSRRCSRPPFDSSRAIC
jgi:hypothetical protein